MKKYFAWILVLLWMAVIFYFSSQPDLKSTLESQWDFVFRKIAHISEFFVLTFLVFRATRLSGAIKNTSLGAAAVWSILYAALDEYHQTFISLRHGSPVDVAIDGVGILICLGMIYFSKKSRYENLHSH